MLKYIYSRRMDEGNVIRFENTISQNQVVLSVHNHPEYPCNLRLYIVNEYD